MRGWHGAVWRPPMVGPVHWACCPIVLALVCAWTVAHQASSPLFAYMWHVVQEPPPVMRSSLDRWGPIRRWGCNRTETPFIFVHIGKAGGGTVRRRIVAAALNYTRSEDRTKWADRGAYYPVDVRFANGTSTTVLARFDNSGHRNWRPNGSWRSYEGTMPCVAQTPIGQAIACPEIRRELIPRWQSNCPDECCVYVGHNFVGNEMHWLPRPYLKRWWEANYGRDVQGNDPIGLLFSVDSSLNGSLCSDFDPQMEDRVPNFAIELWTCSRTLDFKVDAWAHQTAAGREFAPVWSFAYASLPLLRVTLVRETFDWLLSRHGWDRLYEKHNLSCHNISEAAYSVRWGEGSLEMIYGPGWAHRLALSCVLQLCGEDCLVRWNEGVASIAELERQARENLRYSFAVVGLSHEPEVFYKMVLPACNT
ncbi:unnamed protein product [Prorocentrum cordatum]|uniref:Uncharacterized protein n=1 Tax=Prorocentrum cordatum TaxID=2364126 RepID=A0ABN9QW78_9DINO|nr:unnamed protein product [Polarella glacialis]